MEVYYFGGKNLLCEVSLNEKALIRVLTHCPGLCA